MQRFLEVVATLIGRCPAGTASKSLAYEGESYSITALNEAYKAAQQAYRSNVDAACSDNLSLHTATTTTQDCSPRIRW